MIGKLRHKIEIRSVSKSGNGFSEPTTTETTRLTTFASIEEISRNDSIRAGLEVEVSQYKVTIRSAGDTRIITKDDKVIWRNNSYLVRTSPSKITLENRDYYEFIITKG